MKPLRLMMKAIGPYANEQILDFHGFTDKGIFLIHGPTGSGKTTILDAISFALFGVCSNAEIDPKKIRSDHAPDEIPTEVLLDFQIGRDTYRVFRRLEQLKTKKSGQGKTRIPSEATLWRRTGVIDDSSECAAIATQWKRVTEQIESILGLEAQQFSQVVVLPQGQFRKLLVASSKERQQILETLFQTQHYRNIEEALKQKAKEIAEELKQCETVLKSILSRYEARDIVELNNKLESARLELVKTSDEILILREDREKAETVLTEARNQINKLQELLKTQDTLKGLLARQERFTLKRNEVKKARLASQLEEIYRNRELRFDEAQKAEKKLVETQAKHQHAIGSVNGSMAILETERQREPERESLRKHLEELENFVSRVQGLDADKKKLERASKKEKEIRTKLNNNENQTLNSEKLLPEKREKAAVLQNTASQIEFLNLKLAQLKKALQDDTEIKKLKELASLATADLAQNSSEETDCSTQLDNLAEELSIAEEAWLGGQSSLLAQSLAPGKPCPVCGSLDHPSPTRWTQKIPDEARIKKLRKSHDQQRNTLEKIRAAGLEINSRILGFLESIRIRTENLQQMEVDLSRDISQQIKKMAQNVRECNEAARQRELLKQEILELEKRLEEIKQINK
ncbi:MAG: SMC family ATPase, partial [Deltaproteobacteria bacterium]|nr:SMC family ATPase [Deltaproteobacteria bacterium]